MKEKESQNLVSEEPCLPCQAFGKGPLEAACTPFKDYVTPEEEEVMGMLRELKEKARELRGKIRGLEHAMTMLPTSNGAGEGESPYAHPGHGEMRREMHECVEQLEALRGEWKEWEARREAERERKMVLLGHGEWREKGN
jgi:hypothetical protein